MFSLICLGLPLLYFRYHNTIFSGAVTDCGLNGNFHKHLKGMIYLYIIWRKIMKAESSLKLC